tara:strand:+ start:1089 stop:1487 length:399 start_codon:yes stop_codon:yes gene_type:complete
MCFFDSPKAPDIVYQGPSEEDIAANKAQLEAFEAASLKQQEDFASALQVQIDEANTKAEQTRQRIEDERAASLANIGAQQTSAYAINTKDIKPENAKVTKPIKKKKDDRKSTLKISTGSVAQKAGTGLNVGV